MFSKNLVCLQRNIWIAKGRSSLLDSLLKSSAAELRFLDDNGRGDDIVAVAGTFLDDMLFDEEGPTLSLATKWLVYDMLKSAVERAQSAKSNKSSREYKRTYSARGCTLAKNRQDFWYIFFRQI